MAERSERAGAREQRAVCSESSFSAASPVGDLLRPCCRSQTDEGDRPISVPISSNVIPLRRRSAMREAQVFMPPSLRNPVIPCQRHSVTAFRDNLGMKDPALNQSLIAVGDRIKHWTKVRGKRRSEVARESGVAYSTLADIENGRQKSSTQITEIARVLRLNPHYLATGEGDPENILASPPPAGPGIDYADLLPTSVLDSMTPTEIELVRHRFLEAAKAVIALRAKQRSKPGQRKAS